MRDSLRFYLHWAGIAALLLILPATHAAGLNDTGITTCSNATQNGLPCPVAGFPGQDAECRTPIKSVIFIATQTFPLIFQGSILTNFSYSTMLQCGLLKECRIIMALVLVKGILPFILEQMRFLLHIAAWGIKQIILMPRDLH